ncbi:MAG: WYL domain-containing protein [Fibrobacteria bacterium]|nr:WYL domain-containing protein [Fibrobacteria bacterium]
MSGKFNRIRRIIGILEGSPCGVTIDELEQKLGIHPRTIKRYLNEIRQAGYIVYDLREGANQKSLYVIHNPHLPPAHLIPSLNKIKKEMNSWGNPKFSSILKQVTEYLNKLNQTGLKTNQAENDHTGSGSPYHIDHGPFSQEYVSEATLHTLETAILKHYKLQIRYSSYESDKEEFVFYPYSLCLRVGTLYAIGRKDKNTGSFLSLSVKRIKRCVSTSEPFLPAKFNIENYYKYCFGQFPRQSYERPEMVVLQIREKWLQKYLKESHFNPPGKIIHLKKNVFFELEMVIKPDFVNWVISLFPFMIPRKPISLVKTIKTRISKSLPLLE